MTVVTLTVVGSVMVAFALYSRWFARHLVTAPMLFMVAGALAFGLFDRLKEDNGIIAIAAELTLVLVLFHDASTVRLKSLDSDWRVSARLLGIGFPLAVLMTFGLTAWLMPAIGVMGAVLIAAAISPTDAGLGAPTVMNPTVPLRVRRLLNVESGLNDGLATPIVLFALTVLAADEGEAAPAVMEIAVIPVAWGLGVGIVLSVVIARILQHSRSHMNSSTTSQTVAVLLTPILIYLVADVVGANAFIAAFVGGIAFGVASPLLRHRPRTARLLETAADLGSWFVWFLAGGLIVGVIAAGLAWQPVVIAVAALTVLRLLPVAISLLGSGFRLPTVVFVGWFGPRGLATVVFALLAIDELGEDDPTLHPVLSALLVAVAISVFAHGISATPFANRYGAWVKRCQPSEEVLPSSDPAPRGTAFDHEHHQTGDPVG
ncbi:MAG: cation:proton antiporter [Actinobacteria bacterium]|nr:cation:proton antiporter [Actinomycetota bacterium]